MWKPKHWWLTKIFTTLSFLNGTSFFSPRLADNWIMHSYQLCVWFTVCSCKVLKQNTIHLQQTLVAWSLSPNKYLPTHLIHCPAKCCWLQVKGVTSGIITSPAFLHFTNNIIKFTAQVSATAILMLKLLRKSIKNCNQIKRKILQKGLNTILNTKVHPSPCASQHALWCSSGTRHTGSMAQY